MLFSFNYVHFVHLVPPLRPVYLGVRSPPARWLNSLNHHFRGYVWYVFLCIGRWTISDISDAAKCSLEINYSTVPYFLGWGGGRRTFSPLTWHPVREVVGFPVGHWIPRLNVLCITLTNVMLFIIGIIIIKVRSPRQLSFIMEFSSSALNSNHFWSLQTSVHINFTSATVITSFY